MLQSNSNSNRLSMPGPIVEDIQSEKEVQHDEHPVAQDVNEEDEHGDVDTDSDDVDADSDDDQEDDAAQGDVAKQCTRVRRKAMLRLGMKPFLGVSRVTIERTNDVKFFFSKPDVFKSPYTETYMIFGEAKIEDLSSQLQTRVAQQIRMPDMGSASASAQTAAVIDEEEEEVDETGVDPLDIELVLVTLAGVSKSKAVKALKTHNGDIVRAVMELTT